MVLRRVVLRFFVVRLRDVAVEREALDFLDTADDLERRERDDAALREPIEDTEPERFLVRERERDLERRLEPVETELDRLRRDTLRLVLRLRLWLDLDEQTEQHPPAAPHFK